MFGEAEGARPFAELLQARRPAAVRPHRPANDLVVLPYSSGTTGLPKGVMLTHRNLVANLCQCEAMENFEGFAERDVIIAFLPFFHIYGMVVIMMFGLAGGATIVSMPRFDLAEFLGLIQKHQRHHPAPRPADGAGLVKHPRWRSSTSRASGSSSRARRRWARTWRASLREAGLPGGTGLRHDGGEPGDASQPHAGRADEARLGRAASCRARR